MRRRVDLWSFVAAMALAYVFGLLMLLSALGVVSWRVDLLAIWQYGFLSLAFASAMDGWLGQRQKEQNNG